MESRFRCPKCGSLNVRFEAFETVPDPSDPSTYVVSEREQKYGIANYRIKCLNCGFQESDWDQEGYREVLFPKWRVHGKSKHSPNTNPKKLREFGHVKESQNKLYSARKPRKTLNSRLIGGGVYMEACEGTATRAPAFWALDSEFLVSGRVKAPEDVHSVQFSNGDEQNTVVLESVRELKEWLHNHRYITTIFGFVTLPDLGSIEEWLGSEHVSYRRRGNQLIGRIRYGSAKITVYDARPLLRSFGLRRLEDCGKLIGYPKLPKPSFLGLRAWQNEREHEQFVEYAKADAIITSRIVKWLYETFGANPEVHASAGTLARDEFRLPKRLKRIKRRVVLSPLEAKVKQCCFAGRSEGFVTGFIPNVTYNDVSSLYPCSLVVTRALEIVGAEPCDFNDLVINDLSTLDYGWIEGIFETHNDLWGLPLRGKNNFYATGNRISGFYHTFDLASAKAEVIAVSQCYKPIFDSRNKSTHNKYVDMLLKKLEGELSKEEKMLAKGILNSLVGKLGQSHPIARTSNFFAYNTVLAHSHFIMSKLFDKCPSQVLAMDTDSIFSQSDMSGKHFELTDGEHSIPIKMDVKGRGDLAFFRSKNYIMKTPNGEYVYGRHGWTYFLEDFLRLYEGDVAELTTRKDIKHTLLTREREALKMAKGRWRTKVVTLDLEKIKSLLKADFKRKRLNYDSYGLIMERRNVSSQAWNYEDVMQMEKHPLLGLASSGFVKHVKVGDLHGILIGGVTSLLEMLEHERG